MRDIDAELLVAMAVLSSGKDPTGLHMTEHDFLTMAPTDSTMLVEGFKALSIAFSSHVSAFNRSPSNETYAAVVDGCVSCHQRACPGPLQRISKRQLPVALME